MKTGFEQYFEISARIQPDCSRSDRCGPSPFFGPILDDNY